MRGFGIYQCAQGAPRRKLLSLTSARAAAEACDGRNGPAGADHLARLGGIGRAVVPGDGALIFMNEARLDPCPPGMPLNAIHLRVSDSPTSGYRARSYAGAVHWHRRRKHRRRHPLRPAREAKAELGLTAAATRSVHEAWSLGALAEAPRSSSEVRWYARRHPSSRAACLSQAPGSSH